MEALLRLRAAAPTCVRELPAEADIAAVEAATNDPLVRNESYLALHCLGYFCCVRNKTATLK